MKLKELLKKYSFDQLYEELQLMLVDADANKLTYQHAYDMMKTLETIPSKKTIHYQLMDDPETGDCISGAPDSAFTTTWEVILDKEIIVDEECELEEIEIMTNAFLCSLFIGRCPRAFLPKKRQLMGEI